MFRAKAYCIVITSCGKRMHVKRPRGRQWLRLWAWRLMLRSGPAHYRWLRDWVHIDKAFGPKHTTNPHHRAYLAMCVIERTPPKAVTPPGGQSVSR